MITLKLLKLLEDNGFGRIDVDLFWQKIGAGKNGIYITDIGREWQRGTMRSQSYEIYCRGADDVASYKKLSQVVDFLESQYCHRCKLPGVEGVDDEAVDVIILPPSSISTVGYDDNHKMVYSITGEILY